MPNACDVQHVANRHAIPVATRVAQLRNRSNVAQLRNQLDVAPAHQQVAVAIAAAIPSLKIGAMNAVLDYTIPTRNQ